jgi:hypothetical protein|tara:strand:- start:179 stop:490 length:312 start_codon:yes stop_codon:yes gene_type:complete
MPIENKQEIELDLSIALRQAFEEAKEAGFGGSYDDFVSSMSHEALRSLLRKGGRVRLDEGGQPIDLVAEWIKLIKIRSRLSESERQTVDDLVNRMLEPEKEVE